MKMKRKLVALFLAVTLGLFSGVGTAFAYQESAWWDTGQINGLNCTQCAGITAWYEWWTGYGWADAQTWVRPTNRAAAAKEFGAKAFVCSPSGVVFAYSDWVYKGTATPAGTWWSVWRTVEVTRGSSWISWGETRHWDGYDYTSHWYNTYKSPPEAAY